MNPELNVKRLLLGLIVQNNGLTRETNKKCAG